MRWYTSLTAVFGPIPGNRDNSWLSCSMTDIDGDGSSEQTGKLHQGLYKLADHYERQTAQVTKRLTLLMEPVLILGLGLVVGFIVIAMLMPIFQMNMIIQ